MKTFELRKNDRNFMEGDTLHLREFDQKENEYTGRSLHVLVTHILLGVKGPSGLFGLQEGFCCMSIAKCSPGENR
jgi:hypothetical protein